MTNANCLLPACWRFPKKPPVLQGPLGVNNKLQKVKRFFEDEIIGPESFAVDEKGTVYTGSHDGAIWQIENDTYASVLIRTGSNNSLCGLLQYEPECGRVHGLKFHPNGYLYVLDAYKGLLQIDVKTREVLTLLTEIGGVPFRFLNGIDISKDGTIYFSDSTSKWKRNEYAYEVIEMNNLGRLVSYQPSTGEAKLLLDGLYLANGVSLSKDESYILISEMSRCQIRRYFLSGPRQGENEIFADNLPGYPDNIHLTSRGTFFVGLPNSRFEGSSLFGSFLDNVSPYPSIKKIVAKLTPFSFYRVVIPKHALFVEMNSEGDFVDSFHDPTGSVIPSGIGEIFETRGNIYFGHFAHPFIGKISEVNLRK